MVETHAFMKTKTWLPNKYLIFLYANFTMEILKV